jgi:hypothetical protein
MTTAHKSGFQWGVILTLALTTIGFATAYGAKAEKLDTIAVTVRDQESRIAKVETTVGQMAGDIRVIRYLLEGKDPSK